MDVKNRLEGGYGGDDRRVVSGGGGAQRSAAGGLNFKRGRLGRSVRISDEDWVAAVQFLRATGSGRPSTA